LGDVAKTALLQMAAVNKKISFFINNNLKGEKFKSKLFTNYFGKKRFSIGGNARQY
jgi:hypothetical protein